MTLMNIVVEAKSKYGVLDKKSQSWLNPDKSVPLSTFEVGKAYTVELKENKGKDGKVYKNIVSASLDKAASPVVAAPKASVTPKVTSPAKAVEHGLSFADKDSRILYQGVAQALVQSNLVLSLDELEPAVVKVVEMIKRLSGTK